MGNEDLTIFDQNVIEFVTVSASYCDFLEHADKKERSQFVDTSIKILSLLYLKANLLPPYLTLDTFDDPECYVTEDIYEIQRVIIANIMSDKDEYLDSFVTELEYSDEPLIKNISEDMTDIYQDIKDFIFVFKLGLNDTMNAALAKCEESFKNVWGPKLLSVLRTLHYIKYQKEQTEEY